MFCYYLLFYSAFSIEMFKSIVENYVVLMGLKNLVLEIKWLSNIEILTQAFLCISILIYTNYFFKIKRKLFLNIIFTVILVLAVYFSFFIPSNLLHFKYLNKTDDVLLIFVYLSVLYFIIIGIIFYKRIEDESDKRLLKQILIFTVVFTPFIIIEGFDFFLEEIFEIFTPMLYGIIAVLTIYHILKYYFNHYFITNGDIKILSDPEISKQVKNNFFNKYSISDREKDVILLVLKGYSNNRISEALFISIATVKTHIYNVFKKTNVKNRYELIYLTKNYIE